MYSFLKSVLLIKILYTSQNVSKKFLGNDDASFSVFLLRVFKQKKK